MKVLIAEDDDNLRELITDYLTAKGLEVKEYENGLLAYEGFLKEAYDLVLLDVMMPEMDGFELCRKIKENSSVPVIFITAMMQENDQLTGYRIGCDDYIIKPFSLPILYAKCLAVMKRNQTSNQIIIGPLVIDNIEKKVYLNQKLLEIKGLDFKLLVYLVNNADCLLTREQIINHVWSMDSDVTDRSVDTHIKNIRKQLGKNCIHTVMKQGYRFETKGLK